MPAAPDVRDRPGDRPGLTRAIAAFAVRTRYEDLPAAVVEGAKRSQLDTLGCMLGGVGADEAPRILGRVMRGEGGSGAATVVGQGFRATPAIAALVNATAGDVIGFSDVAAETMNHPSTSICAAVWACGEPLGSSGREVLAAHAVGLEVAEKVGHGVRPGFHRKGWEPRGLQNTFGAAAACARLLGLDEERTANALGICGAEASGMRAVKGTMSKAYVAGVAARHGVEAARLAAAGFTGPTDVFEARDGVLQTFGEGASGERIAASLGAPWEFVDPGITYKAFPLCTCTHTAIEAAIALRAAHGFAASEVVSIACQTTPGAADWLPFALPANKFQAKYSMPFAVAMALLEGGVTVAAVTDEKARDPRVVELMRRITLDVLPEYASAGYTPGHAPYGCRVTVTLRDGAVHTLQHDRSGWEPQTAPSWEALAGKFRDNAIELIGAEAVEASIDAFAHLEDAGGIATLMALVAAREPQPEPRRARRPLNPTGGIQP